MPLSSRLLAAWTALGVHLVASVGHAEDVCTAHVSFVRLRSLDAASQTLVETLAPHLRAELHARDIGVCTDDSATVARQPIAEIFLHDDRSSVTITIRDLVTNKRIERVLDLASLPADTRLLAAASSVDELLRASWLETLLTPSRPQAPAPVVRAVQASLPPAPLRLESRRVHGELGASLVSALVPGLRTAYGLDAHVGAWLTPHFGAYARSGVTRGVHQSSLNGSAAADVFRGGAGGFASIVPAADRVGLRVEAGLDVLRVSFRTEASEGGRARASPALAALDASLGLRSWVDLGQVRALVAVAGHYAVVPAVGTDATVQGENAVVTGVKGVGLEASVGAAWAF